MKKIYIIAGESSGDFLGSELIKSVKKKIPDIHIMGVGGPLMKREGLQSLFDTAELSVMGIIEVIPSLFHILKRIDQTVADILTQKPDVLVTIDSSGFCNRVIKKLKKKTKEIPCIHYVAPQVWAWKPGRAKKLGSFVDHLLCLLPFEPKYFIKYGLGATFVGHPLTQRPVELSLKDETLQNILILPGSRKKEVETLLPIFLNVCQKISDENLFKKPLHFFLPTLPHLEKIVKEMVEKSGLSIMITTDPLIKEEFFLKAHTALAASGTVSLELAKYSIPHIIAYKMNFFTATLLKIFIKVQYVSLVNILSGKKIIPECLQEECHEEIILKELINVQKTQKNDLNEAFQLLKSPDEKLTSSDLCVEVIQNIVKSYKK